MKLANAGGNQTTGPVTLGASVTLASTNNGNIVFTSTVQSPGTAFNLTVNTGGVTTFSGAVAAGGNPLGSLSTGAVGSTQINGGSVTTSSAQTYGNRVTFAASPTTLKGNAVFNGNLILGTSATTAIDRQVTGN